LAAYLLPSRFEANDDVYMLLFASGKYSGTPEAHLVFINYVYGLFLKLLYSWNNEVEWYSLIFAFFHIVCITVIAWFVSVSSNAKLLFKLLFLCIFYSLELRFIMYFQFTTTAALCAISGLILITEGKIFQNYFGIVLFIVAALIRIEAALLVFLIFSPVFLKPIIINRKVIFTRSVYFVFAGLFIIGLMKFIDYRSYQINKSWNYYEQYNKVRGKINDNPFLWEIKKPADVASYDFSLLGTFFPDGQVLPLNKLVTIKKTLENVAITRKIANILPSLKDFKAILIMVLITSLLFFLHNKDKKSNFVFFLSLCLFLFAFIYIASFGAIKSRVFLPAVMALFVVMFINLQHNKMAPFYIKTSLAISLSFLSLLILRQTLIYLNLDRDYRKSQFSQQEELLDKYLQNSGNTVVPYASNYSIEYNSPFSENNFKTGQMFFSSWGMNNPLNHSILESYLDLIDRHAIFFKKSFYKNMVPLLQKSILYHYGIHVVPETQMESEDYIIIKLKKISSP
jgi:hypothetical protein